MATRGGKERAWSRQEHRLIPGKVGRAIHYICNTLNRGKREPRKRTLLDARSFFFWGEGKGGGGGGGCPSYVFLSSAVCARSFPSFLLCLSPPTTPTLHETVQARRRTACRRALPGVPGCPKSHAPVRRRGWGFVRAPSRKTGRTLGLRLVLFSVRSVVTRHCPSHLRLLLFGPIIRFEAFLVF